MGYSEFVMKMQQGLQHIMGELGTVEVAKVQKNNGVILQGLTIRKEGQNIAPTIYMDKFYQDYLEGSNFVEIMRNFLDIYEERSIERIPDFKFFTEYELVRRKLAFKLINLDKNIELLEDVPYVKFLNLAVVFYCQIQHTEMGNATVLIHNSHLKNWGISKDRLYRDAMQNAPEILPGNIRTMEEVVKELFRQELRSEMTEETEDMQDGLEGAEHIQTRERLEQKIKDLAEEMFAQEMGDEKMIPMLVLTNEQKHFGAACILYKGLLKDFAEEMGRNLFILPSSVHEVILLPENEGDSPDELEKMVREVNTTQVDPEELLADCVYYYDRERDHIGIFIS